MTRLESGTVLIDTALDLLITPKLYRQTHRPRPPPGCQVFFGKLYVEAREDVVDDVLRGCWLRTASAAKLREHWDSAFGRVGVGCGQLVSDLLCTRVPTEIMFG